ncbi:MAG: metallophosphoesterase family protein [Candidatus Moranbacteria bacterium]|nr:metallophosphoesterase family protein [Candidatus Moranbacteria bacterium]
MKYGIISDIHSNLEALEKTLELINKAHVDEIICLGDIVGYGANPNECVEIIKRQCSVVLLGNHDAAVADTSTMKRFNPMAQKAIMWTLECISVDNKKFLSELPYTYSANNLLFVHASPSHPEQWKYIISEETAIDELQQFSEKICFVGHSHAPGIYGHLGKMLTINIKDRFIINVGSVGQPRDGNPMLSFGLFDTDKWEYQHIRSEYDFEKASEKIAIAGLPAELGLRLIHGI